MYLPDINPTEQTINSNGRSSDGQNMNQVVFEEAMITYKSAVRPTVAVVKVYTNGKKCRMGFVESTEYGGIESCTAWLRGRSSRLGQLYKNSNDRNLRRLDPFLQVVFNAPIRGNISFVFKVPRHHVRSCRHPFQ